MLCIIILGDHQQLRAVEAPEQVFSEKFGIDNLICCDVFLRLIFGCALFDAIDAVDALYGISIYTYSRRAPWVWTRKE